MNDGDLCDVTWLMCVCVCVCDVWLEYFDLFVRFDCNCCAIADLDLSYLLFSVGFCIIYFQNDVLVNFF